MKLFKNKGSKEKFKQLSTGTYEVIDFVLENPRDILKVTGSGVVGSSIQAQKVSRMIIMVAKDFPNTPMEIDKDHFAQYDLMVWGYTDRDVYYVAGSMSSFYTMAVSYMSRHLTDSFVNHVIWALIEANYKCRERYGASLFTDEQMYYFNKINTGESVLDIGEKRHKEMMHLINPNHMVQYSMQSLVIDIDNPHKASIMSMAKFSLVGKDKIIAYANPRQIVTIDTLFGTENDRSPEDDDTIATEVVE